MTLVRCVVLTLSLVWCTFTSARPVRSGQRAGYNEVECHKAEDYSTEVYEVLFYLIHNLSTFHHPSIHSIRFTQLSLTVTCSGSSETPNQSTALYSSTLHSSIQLACPRLLAPSRSSHVKPRSGMSGHVIFITTIKYGPTLSAVSMPSTSSVNYSSRTCHKLLL